MEVQGFTLPQVQADNTCKAAAIVSGGASAIARAYPDPGFKGYLEPYLKNHCQGRPLTITELCQWEPIQVKDGEVWFKITVKFKYEE